MREEIILGEAPIIAHLLFGDSNKKKQLIKIMTVFDFHFQQYQKEITEPVKGYWIGKN